MSKFAITVTDIYDSSLEQSLKLLKARTWCRLVIDELKQDYIDCSNMILKYCDIIPQLVDSYREPLLSDAEYLERMHWVSNHFPFNTIEISNELNDTSWTSEKAWQRTIDANNFFNRRSKIVTLFDQPGVVQFWNANKIPGVDVWLSFYPHRLSDFSGVAGTLSKLGAVGLSECGMEEFDHPKPSSKKYVMSLAASLGVPVCWWDLDDLTMLQKAFDTRKENYES